MIRLLWIISAVLLPFCAFAEEVEEKAASLPTVEEEKKDPDIEAFYSLPISMLDRQNIGRLLTIMAENSVFKLLFEKKRLERIGHDINHVHPIRFIATLFSDFRLVTCLQRIKQSTFKWDGFVDGFSERLRQEVRAKNVNRFVPGMAKILNVNAADVQAYINYDDFEGLMNYLIEKKKYR